MSDQYDAQTVIDEANAKLQEGEGGVNAAQMVYQSALLDWVDDVTMGGDMGDGLNSVREEIVKLWLAYADLNRKSNKNKSATEVYDQATNCPVAGGMAKVWEEYTQFLEGRGRHSAAQKVYLRALVGQQGGEGGEGTTEPAVKDPAGQAALWDSFLRMMQSVRENPDLTLEELKAAVENKVQSGADRGSSPVPDGQASPKRSNIPMDETGGESRPPKRSRWDKKVPVETDAVSARSINTFSGLLLTTSKIMPPEIETLWHARDGGSLPSRPEPPLFTASPPKLGDPSGKDLVGNETALQILKMLTAKTHDGRCLGSALLELCHACWMMTALKEEQFVKAQESLEKKIVADREAMEVDLDARSSVAGGALAAVQQANEKERSSFNALCEAQRQELLSSSAWEFRKLLYTQQVMLSSSKVPGFTGPAVGYEVLLFQSKVCSVLHSAFYLRQRVGETSHVNMLNKQLESLEKFMSTTVKTESTERQQLELPPPPQYPPPPMMPPPQFAQPPLMMYPQQQPMMTTTAPPGYQLPPGYPQVQQTMQPQQFTLGQMNQFQPGQR